MIRVWIKDKAVGAMIRNVTFRNIQVLHSMDEQVHLTAGPGKIDGIVFDNVVINGRPLLSAADPRIINENATNIIVIPPKT